MAINAEVDSCASLCKWEIGVCERRVTRNTVRVALYQRWPDNGFIYPLMTMAQLYSAHSMSNSGSWRKGLPNLPGSETEIAATSDLLRDDNVDEWFSEMTNGNSSKLRSLFCLNV